MADRIAQLTPSENSVLTLVVAGEINQDVASELGVSLRTVEYRKSSIMKKLQVKTRAELILLLLRHENSS